MKLIDKYFESICNQMWSNLTFQEKKDALRGIGQLSKEINYERQHKFLSEECGVIVEDNY